MRALAISGRGTTGFLSYELLKELHKHNIQIEAIAVSGTAALPCVLFYSNLPKVKQKAILYEFFYQTEEFNKQEEFAGTLLKALQSEQVTFTLPVTISTADIDTGELILFESREIASGCYQINELREAVKATCGLAGLQSVYGYKGKRLIDSHYKIGVPHSLLQKNYQKEEIIQVELACIKQPYYRFFDNRLNNCSPNLSLFFHSDQLRDRGTIDKIRQAVKNRLAQINKP